MTKTTIDRAVELIDRIEAALWDKYYGNGLDPTYARSAARDCEKLRQILRKELAESSVGEAVAR